MSEGELNSGSSNRQKLQPPQTPIHSKKFKLIREDSIRDDEEEAINSKESTSTNNGHQKQGSTSNKAEQQQNSTTNNPKAISNAKINKKESKSNKCDTAGAIAHQNKESDSGITANGRNLAASKKQSLENLQQMQMQKKINKELSNGVATESTRKSNDTNRSSYLTSSCNVSYSSTTLVGATVSASDYNQLLSEKDTLSEHNRLLVSEKNVLEEQNRQLAIDREKLQQMLNIKTSEILEYNAENFRLRQYTNELEQQLMRYKEAYEDLHGLYQKEICKKNEQKEDHTTSLTSSNQNNSEDSLSNSLTDPNEALKQIAVIFESQLIKFNEIRSILKPFSSLSSSQKVSTSGRPSINVPIGSSSLILSMSQRQQTPTGSSSASVRSSFGDELMPVTINSPSIMRLLIPNPLKALQEHHEKVQKGKNLQNNTLSSVNKETNEDLQSFKSEKADEDREKLREVNQEVNSIEEDCDENYNEEYYEDIEEEKSNDEEEEESQSKQRRQTESNLNRLNEVRLSTILEASTFMEPEIEKECKKPTDYSNLKIEDNFERVRAEEVNKEQNNTLIGEIQLKQSTNSQQILIQCQQIVLNQTKKTVMFEDETKQEKEMLSSKESQLQKNIYYELENRPIRVNHDLDNIKESKTSLINNSTNKSKKSTQQEVQSQPNIKIKSALKQSASQIIQSLTSDALQSETQLNSAETITTSEIAEQNLLQVNQTNERKSLSRRKSNTDRRRSRVFSMGGTSELPLFEQENDEKEDTDLNSLNSDKDKQDTMSQNTQEIALVNNQEIPSSKADTNILSVLASNTSIVPPSSRTNSIFKSKQNQQDVLNENSTENSATSSADNVDIKKKNFEQVKSYLQEPNEDIGENTTETPDHKQKSKKSQQLGRKNTKKAASVEPLAESHKSSALPEVETFENETESKTKSKIKIAKVNKEEILEIESRKEKSQLKHAPKSIELNEIHDVITDAVTASIANVPKNVNAKQSKRPIESVYECVDSQKLKQIQITTEDDSNKNQQGSISKISNEDDSSNDSAASCTSASVCTGDETVPSVNANSMNDGCIDSSRSPSLLVSNGFNKKQKLSPKENAGHSRST
jgi:hypothetical protein